ncbi:MAG TPA: putative Ig domain-containing protein, partial [Tepidisphaeraceae bacterium]|nr:putative Ig domain-containing protein [Tepidisphaeraceae bacterium]
AFLTLDENNLDEQAGIGGHPGHAAMTGFARYVWETGPVDWNEDGDTNDVVTSGVNVNRIEFWSLGTGTVLPGYDDWSNLFLNFRHSDAYRDENGLPSDGVPIHDDDDLPPDEMDAVADLGYGNAAPRVRGLPARILDEGGLVEFTVPATDPEGDALSFAFAPGAPAGAGIDRDTGRFTWQTTPADGYGVYVVVVRVTDAGSLRTKEQGYAIVVDDLGGVAGRHVFYNRSAFDGNDATANAADDAAIPPDKTALRPGEAATFDNVTSYSRGINGIMVDVSLPDGAAVTTADFVFRAGAAGDPGSWPVVQAAPSLTVRPGAGAAGSDRLTLAWPDGTLRNTWLQVTLLANSNSGLSAPDVFYFGNVLGETGDTPAAARTFVTAVDYLKTRRALSSHAESDNPYDFNRDGRVSPLDLSVVRSALRRSLAWPAAAVPPAAALPAGSSSLSEDEEPPLWA